MGLHGLPVGRDRHPGRQRAAHVGPGRAARREQRVQGRSREQAGVRGAERQSRRTGVEDVVAEPDADAPFGRAGPGEDAVGEVVRAEGIALGDIEGGIGWCLAFVVVRAVVQVFHTFCVVWAHVTGERPCRAVSEEFAMSAKVSPDRAIPARCSRSYSGCRRCGAGRSGAGADPDLRRGPRDRPRSWVRPRPGSRSRSWPRSGPRSRPQRMAAERERIATARCGAGVGGDGRWIRGVRRGGSRAADGVNGLRPVR